jgi:hypothetical protein
VARWRSGLTHRPFKAAFTGSNPVRVTISIIKHRGVEQLAARRAHNPKVAGSSPVPATIEKIRLDSSVGRAED